MAGKFIFSKYDRDWFRNLWQIFWCIIVLSIGMLLSIIIPMIRAQALLIVLIPTVCFLLLSGRYVIVHRKYNLGKYWFSNNAVFNQFGSHQRIIWRSDNFYISLMSMSHQKAHYPHEWDEQPWIERKYVVLWKDSDQAPKNHIRAEAAMKKSNALFLPDQDDVRNALRDYLGVSTIPQYPDIQLCSEQKKLDQMLYDVDGNFLYEQYSE